MIELLLQAPLTIEHNARGVEDDPERMGLLHDHELRVGVRLRYVHGEGSPSAMQYSALREALEDELGMYDGQVLNRLPEFEGTEALFEDLARVIFEGLSARLAETAVTLHRVELVETRGGVTIAYLPPAG